MDLREFLRYLQTTSNLSAIQRATGLNRLTIRRYRRWAATQGLHVSRNGNRPSRRYIDHP